MTIVSNAFLIAIFCTTLAALFVPCCIKPKTITTVQPIA